MADDLSLAPWLKKDDTSSAASSEAKGGGLPIAPWLKGVSEGGTKSEVSVGEDIAKTTGPSLLRGGVGVATMPGTMLDLVNKGIDYGFHKLAPETAAKLDKRREEMAQEPPSSGLTSTIRALTSAPQKLLPSYGTAMGAIEEKTGPLYHAQTGVGRAYQGALEVAPSMLMGGGGIGSSLVRALGAGTGGELARAGAEYAKPALPEWAQKWAEPVAQAVGSVAGGMAGPRIVSPGQMTPARAAEVAGWEARDPKLAQLATAGERSQSPFWLDMESRSPKIPALQAKQAEAFTDAAMQRMGSSGKFTPQNLAAGPAAMDELKQLRTGGQINNTEFPNLRAAVTQEKRSLQGVTGGQGKSLEAINELQKDIAGGAANAPGRIFNMTGERYMYMRDRIQGAIGGASSQRERDALVNVKKALDDAFTKSLPADQAKRLGQLREQTSAYKVLSNLPPNEARAVNQVISPADVLKATAKDAGNPAVNLNKGASDLVPLARDTARIMTPHPTPKQPGDLAKALSGIAGGVAGAATAVAHGSPSLAFAESPVYAIAAYENLPHWINMLKNTGGRAAMTGTGQKLLKNQIAAPTGNDNSVMARLLLNSSLPYSGSNLGPLQPRQKQ